MAWWKLGDNIKMASIRPIKLKSFFERESTIFINQIKTKISQKKGIDNDPAPQNKPSTVKRKGKNHWLFDTGETKKNAFKKSASNTGFIIRLSNKRHSGTRNTPAGKRKYKTKARYSDIMDWVGADERYSGAVLAFTKGSRFRDRLTRVTHRQVKKILISGIPEKLKISA